MINKNNCHNANALILTLPDVHKMYRQVGEHKHWYDTKTPHLNNIYILWTNLENNFLMKIEDKLTLLW